MNDKFIQVYNKDKADGKYKEGFAGRDALECLTVQINFYLEILNKNVKMLNCLTRNDIPGGEETKKALQTSSIEICKTLLDCIKVF